VFFHKKTAIQGDSGGALWHTKIVLVAGAGNRRYLHLDFANM
jgi:hypothetical protein